MKPTLASSCPSPITSLLPCMQFEDVKKKDLALKQAQEFLRELLPVLWCGSLSVPPMFVSLPKHYTPETCKAAYGSVAKKDKDCHVQWFVPVLSSAASEGPSIIVCKGLGIVKGCKGSDVQCVA